MNTLIKAFIVIMVTLPMTKGFFCGGPPHFLSLRKLASHPVHRPKPAMFHPYGSVRQPVELNDEDFMTLEAFQVPAKEVKVEIYHNGDRYEGEFLNGKRHGQGVQYFAKVGKSVCGEFRHGKIYTGEGTLYIAKTNNLFEGTWDKGQFTGYAVFTTTNNKDKYHYEGAMVNGHRCGLGKQTYPNGQVYTGNFEQDVRQGPGVIVCRSGNTASGEYRQDRLYNGTGTMECALGTIFTGTWVEGWWQGQGKLITGDGIVYEGNYDRGRLNGEGYVTYPDGHKYKGTFTDGKMSGGVRVPVDQINIRVDDKLSVSSCN